MYMQIMDKKADGYEHQKICMARGLFILRIGILGYFSSISMSGVSDIRMWKVTFKQNVNASESAGWVGKLQQRGTQKVDVQSVVLMENGKAVMRKDKFFEGRAEDRSWTALHPFSSEFYLGDAPKKGRVYQAAVTWKENETSYTDTFRLD